MMILNGAKLRKFRRNMRKTQAEMAEAVDISERYVRDLETGRKYTPSATFLQKLAQFLGVAMEELMIIVEEEI